MKVGVGTIVYEFGGVPLIEAVERVAAHGIEYIDLLAFGDFNPAFYSAAQQQRIRDKMLEVSVRASSVITCAHGNLASCNSAEADFAMEQLKRAALLVKTLGGRQVLMGKGVGNIDFELDRERAWANVIRVMTEYCKWCADRDVLVTLELEPEELHICNGIPAIERFFDAIDAPNLYANIDIGHLNILRTPPAEIAPVMERVIHVHISDNDGLVHTNSIIGEGNTDINDYLSWMIEKGIDENARRCGEVAVAGVEIGHPGEFICDPDYRVLKSLGNVYSRIPAFRESIKE